MEGGVGGRPWSTSGGGDRGRQGSAHMQHSTHTLVLLHFLHAVPAKDEQRVAMQRQLAAAARFGRRMPGLGPQRRPLEVLEVKRPDVVVVPAVLCSALVRALLRYAQSGPPTALLSTTERSAAQRSAAQRNTAQSPPSDSTIPPLPLPRTASPCRCRRSRQTAGSSCPIKSCGGRCSSVERQQMFFLGGGAAYIPPPALCILKGVKRGPASSSTLPRTCVGWGPPC